ncbi:hypothetical protein ACWD5Q_08110 [Streptomyces sp. NPDC002513]
MHTLRTFPAHAARLLLTGLAAALALLTAAGTAEAHPFGTPPVAKVKAEDRTVEITWSAQQDDLAVLHQTAHGNEARYLSSHITVRQNGHTCPTDTADTRHLARDGALIHYTCPHIVNTITLTITALTDINPAYRTISVTQKGNGSLHTASDPTHALTLSDTGNNPSTPTTRPATTWTTDLNALLDHGTVLPLALLAAAAAGAFHACAPGHGKTLAAGYLVGGHGKKRDALWLGAIVAVMHTASVAVLAVGWWLAAQHTPNTSTITNWLQLIAALVVTAVGINLLRRHLTNHSHSHSHSHHPDDHDHSHDHGHSHHIPAAKSLLTRRGILLLGTSGGLLPSPSAFLVLLTGLLTGRVGTAIAMVIAFGAGMALTLTTVSLAVLHGRDALLARTSASATLRTWTTRAPIIAACAVTIGGTTASAIAATHVLTP